MNESLKDKVAVISGAGSGFAKATAKLFAQKDQCSILMFDINEKNLRETAENCKKAGLKVVSFNGDVTELIVL